MEVKGKIICKKSDNKAFKLGDNWYNVNDPVVPYLEKLNKGDEITVVFEKKGVTRYASKIIPVKSETPKVEVKESTKEFACEVCGKELKDGRFKVCYACNKEGLKPKEEKEDVSEPKRNVYYGSPEDIAGKEVGCALGAAATVASGQQFENPEVAKQFVLLLAEDLLEWIRAKK